MSDVHFCQRIQLFLTREAEAKTMREENLFSVFENNSDSEFDDHHPDTQNSVLSETPLTTHEIWNHVWENSLPDNVFEPVEMTTSIQTDIGNFISTL